jgi:hypothetical protein
MKECLGEEDDPIGTMFYPDWSGINKGCLSTDQQSPPQYMNGRPDFWMHATLEECCEANYHYMLNDCLGTSSTGSALVEGLLTFGLSSMILDKSVVVRGNGGIQQHVLNLQGTITAYNARGKEFEISLCHKSFGAKVALLIDKHELLVLNSELTEALRMNREG